MITEYTPVLDTVSLFFTFSGDAIALVGILEFKPRLCTILVKLPRVIFLDAVRKNILCNKYVTLGILIWTLPGSMVKMSRIEKYFHYIAIRWNDKLDESGALSHTD